MTFLRYILPALAVADFTLAQSCSGAFTIENSEDASQVAGCRTYSGNVVLSTDAPSELSFDGELQEIDGNFEAVNAKSVNSLSFGSLQSINEEFTMQNLTRLYNLNMPQLGYIGSVQWQTLPGLQELDFGNGVNTVNGELSIQDTQISSLSKINLRSAVSINIANNRGLQNINWQLESVNKTLTLNANGIQGGLAARFPNLTEVGAIDVSNVSTLDISGLQRCRQFLSVYGSNIERLELDELTRTGGFSVKNNRNLNEISFEKLRTCDGGFGLSSNDKLGGKVDLPELRTVRGAFNVTGAFEGLSTPQLRTVQGATVIKSSEDIGNTCDTYGKGGELKSSGVLQGITTCSGKSNDPNAGTGGGSGTSGGSSSSGAAWNIGPAPGSAFGLFGLLAAILGMF
ncbi:MAG: hypothetical protein M1831_004147 [Alyxoria varia]|nr:MAG: hypothetical protein M1831_004147 [Alyxoria varia]